MGDGALVLLHQPVVVGGVGPLGCGCLHCEQGSQQWFIAANGEGGFEFRGFAAVQCLAQLQVHEFLAILDFVDRLTVESCCFCQFGQFVEPGGGLQLQLPCIAVGIAPQNAKRIPEDHVFDPAFGHKGRQVCADAG